MTKTISFLFFMLLILPWHARAEKEDQFVPPLLWGNWQIKKQNLTNLIQPKKTYAILNINKNDYRFKKTNKLEIPKEIYQKFDFLIKAPEGHINCQFTGGVKTTVKAIQNLPDNKTIATCVFATDEKQERFFIKKFQAYMAFHAGIGEITLWQIQKRILDKL